MYNSNSGIPEDIENLPYFLNEEILWKKWPEIISAEDGTYFLTSHRALSRLERNLFEKYPERKDEMNPQQAVVPYGVPYEFNNLICNSHMRSDYYEEENLLLRYIFKEQRNTYKGTAKICP